jgi:nitrosocyanin
MNGRPQGIRLLIGMLVVIAAVVVGTTRFSEAVGPQKFALVNVIFNDTKIWLPGTIIVHQGDEVELTLVNQLDGPHGFKIDVFGIESVIAAKSKSTVKFTAKTAGLYTYSCHLHPPHIGGQILVLAE